LYQDIKPASSWHFEISDIARQTIYYKVAKPNMNEGSISGEVRIEVGDLKLQINEDGNIKL